MHALDVSRARSTGLEYRSRAEVNGVPVVHVSFAGFDHVRQPRVARGLFAVGDVAIGLVAVGGIALAPLSFGGIATGCCPWVVSPRALSRWPVWRSVSSPSVPWQSG